MLRGLSALSKSTTLNTARLMSSAAPKMSLDTINPHVKDAQYAVRGELVIKADGYRQKLAANPDSLPFKKIVACNIGNPHELGQKPLTFLRQVISLCHYPELMSNTAAAAAFPTDAIARAKSYLSKISGTGAYTHSKGLSFIRDEVAAFIADRDGHKTDPENIFITDGASSGVKMLLQTLISSPTDGVMCPIPQYPLYSASMTLLQGQLVGYYLNEENGWSMDLPELERSYDAAVAAGTTVRAIVIINPGNPTGQCLSEENIKAVVDFCAARNLVLLADEVYQTNVYSTVPFTSFRKVVKDTKSTVPLVSFHSVSKGFIGECGQRGGYFHLTNFPEDILAQLYKLSSISLCSNVTGQLTVGLMVNPPKPSDPSGPVYEAEKSAILDSLKRRAATVAKALNELEGVSCQPVQGALYAFPQITLPEKAIAAAKAAGKPADTFYCLAMLDATGICVVPGTGFVQKKNTFHFRTTILPSEADIDNVNAALAKFHKEFLAKYA